MRKKPNWIKVRGNSETHTQDIFHLLSGKGQNKKYIFYLCIRIKQSV